jgi:hypothetical protein
MQCTYCGKPRGIYTISNPSVGNRHDDKKLLVDFLTTCGSDFSEVASKVPFSNLSFLPYAMIKKKKMKICCGHRIEQNVYKLDNHQLTCYACGFMNSPTPMAGHYPLCAPCALKDWTMQPIKNPRAEVRLNPGLTFSRLDATAQSVGDELQTEGTHHGTPTDGAHAAFELHTARQGW